MLICKLLDAVTIPALAAQKAITHGTPEDGLRAGVIMIVGLTVGILVLYAARDLFES